MANSRVGANTSVDAAFVMRCGRLCPIKSSIGKANAAVLPVPVCAHPRMSWPSIPAGMDLDCIGVGLEYFFSISARFNGSNRSMFSNVFN